MSKDQLSEQKLVDEAVAWLRRTLADGWEIEPEPPRQPASSALDAVVRIGSPPPGTTFTTLVIEAKERLTAKAAKELLAGLAGTLRPLTGAQILVVAPWLDPATRELLAGQRVNYLDLTGNARLSIDNPAIFVLTEGARRNPNPSPKGTARLTGPRAWRLVRLLVDVRPPYGVSAVASRAGISAGYASKLLAALDDEALISRDRRGAVLDADIAGLLRRWADTYDVLRTNPSSSYLARSGAPAALEQMFSLPEPVLLTGSFAAVQVAPVAAPVLLMAYSDDPSDIARRVGLLPADEAPDVVLMQPFDPVVRDRPRKSEGRWEVALSQVAVDCLTGPGRMPSEGEALVEWMTTQEGEWRVPSIAELPPRGAVT